MSWGKSSQTEEEEIHVQEQVQGEISVQEEVQGKIKGKVASQVKGGHIPPKELMIPERDDGHFWGETNDKELLFGYKYSWTHIIYKTYDHKDAVRIFKHQSMPALDLENEC